MKRSEFLKRLGLGAVATAVAPKIIAEELSQIENKNVTDSPFDLEKLNKRKEELNASPDYRMAVDIQHSNGICRGTLISKTDRVWNGDLAMDSRGCRFIYHADKNKFILEDEGQYYWYVPGVSEPIEIHHTFQAFGEGLVKEVEKRGEVFTFYTSPKGRDAYMDALKKLSE